MWPPPPLYRCVPCLKASLHLSSLPLCPPASILFIYLSMTNLQALGNQREDEVGQSAVLTCGQEWWMYSTHTHQHMHIDCIALGEVSHVSSCSSEIFRESLHSTPHHSLLCIWCWIKVLQRQRPRECSARVVCTSLLGPVFKLCAQRLTSWLKDGFVRQEKNYPLGIITFIVYTIHRTWVFIVCILYYITL